LVIEDQYVRINPHSALSVARSKGLVIGILADRFPPERVREVNPQTWHNANGIRGGRLACKAGAMVIAHAAISGRISGELLQDAADAICMGLAAARAIKAERLTRERETVTRLITLEEQMKDNSGPAFPGEQGHTPGGTWNQTWSPGMTLREHYIGQQTAAALGALLAAHEQRKSLIDLKTMEDVLARKAALIGELTADAIIARLKEEKNAES